MSIDCHADLFTPSETVSSNY